MAQSFTISPATSLSWVINTHTGPNAGAVYDENVLFNECDFRNYYNCQVLELQGLNQIYNQADTPPIQFEYDADSASPQNAFVELFDAEGNLVAAVPTTNTGGNIYEATFDFSGLTGCHQARIVGAIFDTGVLLCADNGTFESNDTGWTIAAGNAKARTNSVAQSGSWSEVITSNATPNETHALIGYCPLAALSANTWYYVEAYVYERSIGTTFTATGKTVGFDLGDFSDVTIHSSEVYDPAVDAKNTWHRISAYFKTGSDATGEVKIAQLSGIPNAAGDIYVDTISYLGAGVNQELATSQIIDIQENHGCSLPITYTGTVDCFGIAYEAASGGSGNLVHMIRIPGGFHQFTMKDVLFQTDANSENTARLVTSRAAKVRRLRTDFLPGFMYEKLALALKHQVLTVLGVRYIADEEELGANWGDDKNAAFVWVETELRLQDYNLQASLC